MTGRRPHRRRGTSSSRRPPPKGRRKCHLCVGVESGAASGWPGTDWIEDIVLRRPVPRVQPVWQGTLSGARPRSKPPSRLSVTSSRTPMAERHTVLTTNFEVGGDGLFKSPPVCVFPPPCKLLTGLGAFKTAAAGPTQLLPVPGHRPAFRPVGGRGDLFGMFKDHRRAKSLMRISLLPRPRTSG